MGDFEKQFLQLSCYTSLLPAFPCSRGDNDLNLPENDRIHVCEVHAYISNSRTFAKYIMPFLSLWYYHHSTWSK